MTTEPAASRDRRLPNVGRRVRVPKMAEIVAEHVRRQIVRGELRGGESLPPEATLLARFAVSRPTLREAFRVLEVEGLIVVRRGANGGAKVREPDPGLAARHAGLVLQYRGTTLADVDEARIVLEPQAVAVLAERSDAEAVTRLRTALAEHAAVAHDPMRSIRTHIAFHSLLVELAGNHTLELLMRMVEQIIDQANLAQVASTVGTPAHARASRKGRSAHHLVVELIEAGDREEAAALWRRHLTEAHEYLVRPDVTTVLDLMS